MSSTALAAAARDLLGPAEAPQAVHGRLEEVDRVRVPQAFREDVADARQLEHGADAAAGDDAGSLARGAQQHARGVGAAEHLVGDRRAVLRHLEEVLLCVVHRLRDGERHFARLPVADAYPVDLVSDDDERREREAPAALDDLRHAVDLDDPLLELAGVDLLGALLPDSAQNFKPPSLAASASAFTRPW